MRYRNKTKSMRVVLRLIVGLTTSLFVLSLTNALNAEDVTSHKGRFWNAKPVGCGDTLEYGRFELTGDLDCDEEYDPAIKIIGPAKLNLKGYTLSSKGGEVCILIEGDGASIRNGTIMNCREEGILIKKSAYSKVINVTVKNCKEGIVIEKSDRNKLINVKAFENERRGFRIKKSSDNLLINCHSKENGRKGFSIEENGDDNLLVNCMAKNNGQQGFKVEIGDRNNFYYNKAIANCRDGIEIQDGSYNRIINNLVEDNGNKKVCDSFADDPTDPGDDYYYKPWFYAGIDVLSGSENNKIKHNRAGCNLGCVGSSYFPCTAHERDFWDENVDTSGNCASNNEWENNSIECKNAVPECSPNPDD